jgi:serine/threonine protein kinase
MSPEQARGEKLDGRSDIYSLGIIMYELLTGKLPFDANQPMEFIQKHIKEPPLPLVKRAPNRDWPQGLWEVLEKSLAKKPDQRFATANEFAAGLKNVISPSQPPAGSMPPMNSPVPVPVPTPPTQTSPVPAAQPQVAQQAPVVQAMPQAGGSGSLARAPNALHAEAPPAVAGVGSTPKVAWLVLGLGALLALLGTAALVIAILLR